MRIAPVNDITDGRGSDAARLSLRPNTTWACTTRDGAEAIDRIMPGIDGVEATRQIMPTSGAQSSSPPRQPRECGKAFEAMGAGALGVLQAPTLGANGTTRGAGGFFDTIDAIAKLLGEPAGNRRVRLALARTG